MVARGWLASLAVLRLAKTTRGAPPRYDARERWPRSRKLKSHSTGRQLRGLWRSARAVSRGGGKRRGRIQSDHNGLQAGKLAGLRIYGRGRGCIHMGSRFAGSLGGWWHKGFGRQFLECRHCPQRVGNLRLWRVDRGAGLGNFYNLPAWGSLGAGGATKPPSAEVWG